MNYIEVSFVCEPNNETVNDILSASLAEIGFESFVESENGTVAYIQEKLFDESLIKNIITNFNLNTAIRYTQTLIADRDWNEEWEKNYFEPFIIDNQCIIKSTFHQTEDSYKYTIVIDPKMAFGTGHHQTTELMIREILKINLVEKAVLDMGCGTAILAILASLRGADPIAAIDIDEWAYNNAIENLALNHINNVDVKIGGAELLSDKSPAFDVIFANINRNILLQDIPKYATALNKGGNLYMSGFYTEDIPAIESQCEKNGLEKLESHSKDNWAVVCFSKRQ